MINSTIVLVVFFLSVVRRGGGVTVAVSGSAGACLAKQSMAKRFFGPLPAQEMLRLRLVTSQGSPMLS